jgi:arylsulfatase A-like enzyme
LAGGVTPWEHRYKTGEYSHTWHRNGELIEEEGHVTPLITREAVRWIESRDERPFFLYVPYTAPHIPIDEPEKWLALYPGVRPLTKQHYAAGVSHMDAGVGEILAALERSGRRKNTVVIFFSDNGADPGVENNDTKFPGSFPAGPTGGSNVPLRGVKRDLFEGGIRVPAVVSWPGRLKPGKFPTPVHAVDWMPTLCALAGWTPKSHTRWDGRDLSPALAGAGSLPDRPFYWAGTDFREAAVRDGDWKLIVSRENSTRALFNLKDDPFETRDLAPGKPELVDRLESLLNRLAAADTAPRSEPAK